jgi:hypothetical protein
MYNIIIEILYLVTVSSTLFLTSMIVKSSLDIWLQVELKQVEEKSENIRVGFGRQRANSWPI